MTVLNAQKALADELRILLSDYKLKGENDEMKSTGKYFYELSGCDSKVLDKLIK